MCKCTQPHGCKLSQLPASWEAWHVRRPKILWWKWLAFRQCRGLTRACWDDPYANPISLMTLISDYTPGRTPTFIDLRHSSWVSFAKVVIFGWRYYKWLVSRSQLWGGPAAKAAWAPLIYGHRMPWGKGCLGIRSFWSTSFSVDKSISFHERLGFSTLAHLNKEIARLRIIQDKMAKYKVSCFAISCGWRHRSHGLCEKPGLHLDDTMAPRLGWKWMISAP